ncbi:MAG: hypothetical protein QM662_09620 [Gordonia sp. (in: high G+C Gram-positive bacteria)]
MSILLGLICAVIVVGAAIGAVIAVVVSRSQRSTAGALEIYPGQFLDPPAVPGIWALGHTPEARLFRRLRTTATTLHNAAATDAWFIDARVQIELAATEVGTRLIALATVDPATAAQYHPAAETWVSGVESLVGQLVVGAPVTPTQLDAITRQLPIGPPS